MAKIDAKEGTMSKIETTRFDAADYLGSAEDAAAYLDAYLEDGSLAELRAALDTVARSRGMSDLAQKTGLTRAGLYKSLGKRGNPSLETIQTILHAMGMRLAIEPVESEEKREYA
ncbi:addiction module antidote protein [Allopontixanthobacter sediminis]|nr:addiction module antidote protein [Allopontixanthobacter sediminis]